MAELPVTDLLDARLADLLAAPGCPICRYRDETERRHVEQILSERVTDRTFRAELDVARGFCPLHTRALLATNRARIGGSLGAGILLGAILKVRLRELEGATQAAPGRGRARRATEASRPPACPVCAHAHVAERFAVERLATLAAGSTWASALAAAPFCLDHLLSLTAVSGRDGWDSVAKAQHARLSRLSDRLDAFAHHSSHDRRHLMTDGERAAPDEVADLLAGGGIDEG